MKAFTFFAVATAFSFSVGNVIAQEPANKNQPLRIAPPATEPLSPVDPSHWTHHRFLNFDQKLATYLAVIDQEQLALARHALDKIQNTDVQHFAQIMIEDCQMELKKLARHARHAALEGYLLDTSGARTAAAERNNSVQQTSAASKPDSGRAIQQAAAAEEKQPVSEEVDAMHLYHELAEECVRLAMDDLDMAKGKDLDRCFIQQQLAKQHEMKAKLLVFERHARGDLRQIMIDGMELNERHLKRSKELLNSLDSSR